MQTYIFVRVSKLTGKTSSREIALDIRDYRKWWYGDGLIQNTLSYLSPDDREFLMTGITPEEWANEIID